MHFRGQKGGPVNPVSFKYSSPSKVNVPAKPVGQEKAEGGRDVDLWGAHNWDLPPQLGQCCLLVSPCWTKQCPYLCLSSGEQVPALLMPGVLAASQGSDTMLSLFSLQQPSTELSACYSELTEVNHRVLSLLPKLAEVAKLGLLCRTFFYPH